MPPTVWPARCVEISPHFSGPDSQSATVVMHCQTSAAVNNADLVTLATAMFHQLITPMSSVFFLGYLSTAWTMEEVVATDLTGSAGQGLSTQTPYVGTNTDEALTAPVSILTSWLIGRRYRGGHPRSYWPGLANGDLDIRGGKLINSTLHGQLQTAIANVLSGFEATTITGGGTVLLGSVQHSTVHTPIGAPVFWPFTGVVVRQTIATQRRRIGRRTS